MLNTWAERVESDLPIPIEDQSKLLDKKYVVEAACVDLRVFDEDRNRDMQVPTDVSLICFKEIICKYRPHLHMGDFWLHVRIVNNNPVYTFFTKIVDLEGQRFILARHPHLSSGIPCLGSHQADINTAFQDGNYVRFMSQMRQYLCSYYGRSTYVRGSAFKKKKMPYQLHSNLQIQDIFSDDGEINVVSVAEDSMRWNWPKEITAWGYIIVQGQDANGLFIDQFINQYNAPKPYIYNTSNDQYAWANGNHTDSCSSAQKINGYIHLAMTLGEMPLYIATNFVALFLKSLHLQYMNDMTEEKLAELRHASQKLNHMRYSRGYEVSPRYNNIPIDAELRNECREAEQTLSKFSNIGNGSDEDFYKSLKYGGEKITNFMILLRKGTPENATANGYLSSINDNEGIDKALEIYKKVNHKAVSIALQQLKKEERRFINELNKKPNVIHTPGDGAQSSLFTE